MDAAVLQRPVKPIPRGRAARNGDMAKLVQLASGGTKEPVIMETKMYRTFLRAGMVARHDDKLIYLTNFGVLYAEIWANEKAILP